MIRNFFVLTFVALIASDIHAQCPGIGQNPSSAFPVCGTAVFNKSTVPSCNGRSIVNFCNDGAPYTDVNPYYYKFICYVAGPLEFLLTPNGANVDYDWQLHDITGKNPNDIFTDPSTIVSYNWSGNTGPTGTNTSASTQFGCSGTSFPLIVAAPTLIVGHEYLLMVSDFSNSAQGYNLTFSASSSALVTDPNIPNLLRASTVCNSKEVRIKLNKKVLCKSITTSGSEILINGLPVISAAGIGCSTEFDTDSIIAIVSNVLPLNNTIQLRIGTDGDVFTDNCNNTINTATILNFKSANKPIADFTFNAIGSNCLFDTLLFSHDANNNVNQWQWTFDGTPISSTNQAQQVVMSSIGTRNVKLVVNNLLCNDSISKIIPAIDKKVNPKINITKDISCPNIPQTFTDASASNTTKWDWNFGLGQTSSLKNPPSPVYPVLANNTVYPISLKVTNNFGCIDSTTTNFTIRGTIPTEFDSIIPTPCDANQIQIYFKQDMVCTSVAPDGSDFSLTGVAPNTITSANIACANGVGTIVTLNVATALQDGIYTLTLKKGTDNNTIINDCGIACLNSVLSFRTYTSAYTPTIITINKWGCVVDTTTLKIDTTELKSWSWNFVNGSSSLTNSLSFNPTSIYTYLPNEYLTDRQIDVTFTRGTCTSIKPILIKVPDHFIDAKIFAPDTTCGFGNTILIDSSYKYTALNSGIVSWNWDFGFGTTSTLQNPVPVNFPLNQQYKTYTTRLIIKNTVGCVDTTYKDIVVKPSSPATMNKIGHAVCSPDSIILTFNSAILCSTLEKNGSDFIVSGPSNVTVSSAYVLNCNNNAGKIVVVKFANPINVNGTYIVNLVKGSDGNTILNDCNIETPLSNLGFLCFTKVSANFNDTIKSDCKTGSIKLTHNFPNTVQKWTWVENGAQLNQTSGYTTFYNYANTKTIKLIVNNFLCSDTVTRIFNLPFDNVKAKFVADKEIVCATEPISFFNLSTGIITSYEWDFGDSKTSTSRDIVNKIYDKLKDTTNQYGGIMLTGDNNKSFVVKLKVTNANLCSDETELKIKVTSNCLIKVPTAFTPNGDGLNDYLYPLNAYKAKDIKFSIYNRTGKLIFFSSDMNSRWNGSNYSKERQPAGTYVWTLEYIDKDTNKEVFMKGTTVLIR